MASSLISLRHLDLRANKLTLLPERLAELANLEKLDLQWNRLLVYPEWLERMQRRGCTVFI
jgi:Leucine-rich repeat (LRR) protein